MVERKKVGSEGHYVNHTETADMTHFLIKIIFFLVMITIKSDKLCLAVVEDSMLDQILCAALLPLIDPSRAKDSQLIAIFSLKLDEIDAFSIGVRH